MAYTLSPDMADMLRRMDERELELLMGDAAFRRDQARRYTEAGLHDAAAVQIAHAEMYEHDAEVIRASLALTKRRRRH